jgi:hypothetical protein
MERRLEKLKKAKSVFKKASFLCIFAAISVAAQTPSQTEQLRIQIWSDLDKFPGKFEEEDEISAEKTETAGNDNEFRALYGFAIDTSKKIAPFLMGGMLYGWNFDYTPYDKTRKVDEFWEFSSVQEFNPSLNRLEFHNPAVKDGRLVSWVYCDRTAEQKLSFERWSSIVHPKIKGTGKAKVEDEFDGIREACSQAAKNAVRQYWRSLVKNKPKEISGTVLLIGAPRIYIKSGLYIVELDFFMETDRIVPYIYF